jgi:hypothetical protein
MNQIIILGLGYLAFRALRSRWGSFGAPPDRNWLLMQAMARRDAETPHAETPEEVQRRAEIWKQMVEESTPRCACGRPFVPGRGVKGKCAACYQRERRDAKGRKIAYRSRTGNPWPTGPGPCTKCGTHDDRRVLGLCSACYIAKGRDLTRKLTYAPRGARRAGYEPPHGTISTYSNHKCRCDLCRAAMRAASERLRRKKGQKPRKRRQ